MKPSTRKILYERMELLIKYALANAKVNPQLSQRYASLARKISTRHKVRMPYHLRFVFCKKCKKFMAPGVNSRIRIGRTSRKSIRITCTFCEHTYRKILSQ